jgi:hypothetical protein
MEVCCLNHFRNWSWSIKLHVDYNSNSLSVSSAKLPTFVFQAKNINYRLRKRCRHQFSFLWQLVLYARCILPSIINCSTVIIWLALDCCVFGRGRRLDILLFRIRLSITLKQYIDTTFDHVAQDQNFSDFNRMKKFRDPNLNIAGLEVKTKCKN